MGERVGSIIIFKGSNSLILCPVKDQITICDFSTQFLLTILTKSLYDSKCYCTLHCSVFMSTWSIFFCQDWISSLVPPGLPFSNPPIQVLSGEALHSQPSATVVKRGEATSEFSTQPNIYVCNCGSIYFLVWDLHNIQFGNELWEIHLCCRRDRTHIYTRTQMQYNYSLEHGYVPSKSTPLKFQTSLFNNVALFLFRIIEFQKEH